MFLFGNKRKSPNIEIQGRYNNDSINNTPPIKGVIELIYIIQLRRWYIRGYNAQNNPCSGFIDEKPGFSEINRMLQAETNITLSRQTTTLSELTPTSEDFKQKLLKSLGFGNTSALVRFIGKPKPSSNEDSPISFENLFSRFDPTTYDETNNNANPAINLEQILNSKTKEEFIKNIDQWLKENDINSSVDQHNNTLLHRVFQIKQHWMADILIEIYKAKKSSNKDNRFPDYYDESTYYSGANPISAIKEGWYYTIKRRLLKGEITLESTDQNGDSLVHWAAHFGDISMLRFLSLLPGWDGVKDNYNNEGYTPIAYAVMSKEKSDKKELVIRFLLYQGVDPNKGKIKNTPIHLAIYTAQDKIVQLLLGYNMDIGNLREQFDQVLEKLEMNQKIRELFGFKYVDFNNLANEILDRADVSAEALSRVSLRYLNCLKNLLKPNKDYSEFLIMLLLNLLQTREARLPIFFKQASLYWIFEQNSFLLCAEREELQIILHTILSLSKIPSQITKNQIDNLEQYAIGNLITKLCNLCNRNRNRKNVEIEDIKTTLPRFILPQVFRRLCKWCLENRRHFENHWPKIFLALADLYTNPQSYFLCIHLIQEALNSDLLNDNIRLTTDANEKLSLLTARVENQTPYYKVALLNK